MEVRLLGTLCRLNIMDLRVGLSLINSYHFRSLSHNSEPYVTCLGLGWLRAATDEGQIEMSCFDYADFKWAIRHIYLMAH